MPSRMFVLIALLLGLLCPGLASAECQRVQGQLFVLDDEQGAPPDVCAQIAAEVGVTEDYYYCIRVHVTGSLNGDGTYFEFYGDEDQRDKGFYVYLAQTSIRDDRGHMLLWESGSWDFTRGDFGGLWRLDYGLGTGIYEEACGIIQIRGATGDIQRGNYEGEICGPNVPGSSGSWPPPEPWDCAPE